MRCKWQKGLLFCVTMTLLLSPVDVNAARIPSLFPADSGDTVVTLQQKLRDLGYYTYPEITGFYGDHTQAAVMAYQESQSLYADGIAGDNTLRGLFGDSAETIYSGYVSAQDTVLKLSMRGSDVEMLQRRLRELRYLPGDTRATGYYGTLTQDAVKRFQRAHSLDADGVIGPQSLAILYSDDAKRASESDTANTESVAASAPKANTDKGKQVVALAKEQLGKKYVFGSSGPNTFDCSGFVMFVFDQIGVSLPHSAQSMGYGSGVKISKSELKAGDLVFFNTDPKDGDLCDHVGIYIGNGDFIHASSGSSKKVVISNLSNSYYVRTYSWARRVL